MSLPPLRSYSEWGVGSDRGWQIILYNNNRLKGCICLALFLVLKIISGMFGDYLYKSHTITQINKIKENDDDIDFAYRKKGGVNISFFFLALLVVQYLPSILIQLL